MHVPVSVSTFTAISALLVVSLATLLDASSGQNSIFSEARAYEHFMGRWSRKLAPLFVRFAGVRDADTVLDVGSGTGALTAAIAKVAPSSRIVGIDPSASYVALAQSQHGSRLVLFEVGDAQHMRFDAAMFDRTLSLLVVNFIPDVGKALSEMTRVTKPKGTVAAAVWDYGEGMEMLRAFWDAVVALDPAADARDERQMPLCRRGELAALWRGGGLAHVDEQPLTIDLVFPSFDDYWMPFLGGQGPAGAYAASLSGPARTALADELRLKVTGGRGEGPFTLRGRAWAVTGVVPAGTVRRKP